jgi:hypothetical protein
MGESSLPIVISPTAGLADALNLGNVEAQSGSISLQRGEPHRRRLGNDGEPAQRCHLLLAHQSDRARGIDEGSPLYIWR